MRVPYQDGRMDDRSVAQVQKGARDRLKQRGVTVGGGPNLEDHNHTLGTESCPLCSKHDHSDIRWIGTDGGVDCPAWHITCPKCGTPEVIMQKWTDMGKAIARAEFEKRDAAREAS
jgi:hypothetical protein